MPETIQDTESRTPQGETNPMSESISSQPDYADEAPSRPEPDSTPAKPEQIQEPVPESQNERLQADVGAASAASATNAAEAAPTKRTPAVAAPSARTLEPRASFSLPNAKVGVEYIARIDARNADGQPPIIQDVKLPEGLGLHFDPESGELRGTPLTAGDHRLPLRWSPGKGISYSGECLLIVNPDPRSLWKVVEPPEEAPYPKLHTDSRLIQTEDVRLIAASRRGRSHEHAAASATTTTSSNWTPRTAGTC
jgi:hypothetical protein